MPRLTKSCLACNDSICVQAINTQYTALHCSFHFETDFSPGVPLVVTVVFRETSALDLVCSLVHYAVSEAKQYPGLRRSPKPILFLK